MIFGKDDEGEDDKARFRDDKTKDGLAITHSDKVIIAIQDNGPGIAPDKINQVFQPFYTTKQEGTGLGLYVVKQLVEKNQGRIKVASREGRGTVFTITLPVFVYCVILGCGV